MADDLQKRRRAKNIAVGLVLAGLAALFYLITLVKLTGGAGS
jgi:hypothetical protein